ncbi:hypothetical protein O0I10_006660 [Lichtheimia ornata]|uniref:F-box domain-containing protein n=1 Tax=Lichtheimia ornata TaxID=688661 RepID=A0AAD7V4Q2_9FUNG|nr:uncharacterized protein O0I10_006660 [Lichtheimia ornata]KAJ8657596.1 hypothetical protein O0I10_006660 [Lichtheimia ornata]
MTHSILGDLCNPPTLTTTTEKYVQLVHDATTELHEPVQSNLSALDVRANALTKLANFESALHDANAMQQLSPSSALGYIRAADIYSEQGKQRQVIDICNQALDVVDTKDMGYDTLQRAKDVAMQRQSTRIDFVSQLPVDVVITTLIPMFMDHFPLYKQCAYLYVSREWRDRIIQCFGELSFVVSERGHSQVIELSRYTTSLHIGIYSEGTWLSDLIDNNDFCALREIHIQAFWTIHIGRFLSTLKSISGTLTHLNLNMESGPDLGLAEIVMVCPNLKLLNIRDPADADATSLPMTTWPTLTTLSLLFAHKDITRDQVIAIWKRFPSLKKLQLSPCTDVQSTLLVSEYCPWINRLDVSVYSSGIQLVYSDEENSSEQHGVTKITMAIKHPSGKTCKDTSSIVKKYHNTLEHLEWGMDSSLDTENIEHLQYPRLKKLALCRSGWQIPRYAPLLEELMLTSRIITTHPDVFDMISPHLIKLELKLQGAPQLVDKSSIVRFLGRVALQCQLKELVVRFHSEDNVTSVMDAIYRLDQLECLKISFTRVWDPYRMERFFDRLVKACPLLSRLELKCDNAPSIYSMNTLKGLAHLNMFAFCVYGSDGFDGFWDAIRTFSQLKCIRIYPDYAIHQSKITYLKKECPYLKVIIDRDHRHF